MTAPLARRLWHGALRRCTLPNVNAIDIEKLLLASAAEDYAGLYEAIWELNAAFPAESLGDKYDAAAAALRALLGRGWITLYERSPLTDGEYRYQAIPAAALESVLANPVSWYPDYSGLRIVFSITAAGEQAWSSTAPHNT
jgi:hypothetical protein